VLKYDMFSLHVIILSWWRKLL